MGCIFSRFFLPDKIIYSRELQTKIRISNNDIYNDNQLELVDHYYYDDNFSSHQKKIYSI